MGQITYQVGGSLTATAPTYIERQADADLFTALQAGEFCYVLNCRQMGKSSLMVRTRHRLAALGYRCATVDMTNIGSENITPLQWYKGVVGDLWLGLGLPGPFNLKTWWQELPDLSLLQRLSRFFAEVVLPRCPEEHVVIFIDEIDSILSLEFPVDDFFALIRYCYNQRAVNPAYQRLTFAILGVATPPDLIQDKTRTPFNIGQAIALDGFSWTEAQPLAAGLPVAPETQPTVLREILYWTGGQPFLTQKLCQMLTRSSQDSAHLPLPIPPGTEAFWVESLVQKYVVTHWQAQDEPEHLRTIRDRLLRQPRYAPRCLHLYQQLLDGQPLPTDDSREQTELLLSGLVVRRQGQLHIKNPIYAEVFNTDWVTHQLEALRPYSQTFEAWVASGQQDTSRLLRGQALAEATQWAQGKSLSDLDYQFLQASQVAHQQEIEQRLEAERLTEMQGRLQQERRAARLKSILLGMASLGFLGTLGLSLFAGYQFYQAKLSEVKALASSSQGQFASDQQLDAMVAAIKAQRIMQRFQFGDARTQRQVLQALNQVVFGSNEVNRLTGHTGALLGIAISPDGRFFASAGNDKTAKLWARNGQLLRSLPHDSTVLSVTFSPDSQQVVTGSLSGEMQVWNLDGRLAYRVSAHQGPMWGVAVSPDGSLIASGGGDKTVKLWRWDGTLVTTMTAPAAIRNVDFSADGQLVAGALLNGTVQVWSRQGQRRHLLQGHQGVVWDVAFCPQRDRLVSVSADGTIKIWTVTGELRRTLKPTDKPLRGVDCSANGQYVAAAGQDSQIHIWTVDGMFVRTLKGHQSAVRDVAFSPDGSELASISQDSVVKIWRRNTEFLQRLHGAKDTVWSIAVNPAQRMVSASGDVSQIILWKDLRQELELRDTPEANLLSVAFVPDQPLLVGVGSSTLWLLRLETSPRPRWTPVWSRAIPTTGSLMSVAVSRDGRYIATGSDEGIIRIWDRAGTLLKQLNTGNDRIWQIDFQPVPKAAAPTELPLFVLAAANGAVELWRLDGTKVRTLKERGTVASWGAVFSPDGTLVAASSYDDTLRLWRLDGTLRMSVQTESRGLTRVAFSPDGQTIATGGLDAAVKLWNLDGTLKNTLVGHENFITSLAYSLDGQYLFSGGADSQVVAWKLQQIAALDPVTYACNWVQDYLRTNVDVAASDRDLCAP